MTDGSARPTPPIIDPLLPSRAFMDEWLNERELIPSWGRLELAPGAAFRIVTHDITGTPRPDLSRTRLKMGSAKYLCPAGIGAVIYAPQPDSFEKFEAATEKWIAEGEGKALALVGLGLPVLGIGGVRGWHLSGSEDLHPDIASRIKLGDRVQIAIDGDFQTNPNVRKGAELLMHALRALRAVPELVVLPSNEDGGKIGIDDQIAMWRRAKLDPAVELAKLPRLADLRSPNSIIATKDVDLLVRPPQKWIVKNLIPADELTAIVGDTSSGKTFLTMDLLLTVARGESYWFRQRIKTRGLAVHVTLEGSGLANRRRAYQQHHRLSDPLPYLAVESPVNLREDADRLIKTIRLAAQQEQQEVVLIAIDTVNRAMGGGGRKQ